MTTEACAVRTPDLLRESGLSPRQLTHWTDNGVLRPHREGKGQGFPRTWPPIEVEAARILARLLDAGLTMPAVVSALKSFREVAAHDETDPYTGFDVFLGAGLWLTVTRGL